MKKLMLACLAASISVLAQQASRVVEVKHLTGDEMTRTQRLLGHFGVNGSADPVLRVFVISGPKEAVDAVESYLKRVDVPKPPARNFELTVYLMEASRQPSSATPPPALESVIKQLRSVFAYQGYQLVDTITLRAREEDMGRASGVLPAPQSKTANRLYEMEFQRISSTADAKGNTIRLDKFNFNVKIPYFDGQPAKLQYTNVGIRTDVDIREGQKVVVGKAKVDDSDASLFLVVMAKVVD